MLRQRNPNGELKQRNPSEGDWYKKASYNGMDCELLNYSRIRKSSKQKDRTLSF